ncbi:MAG: hypothetical protein IPI01_18050 [Ignavibacteriae bacterium]|nr:hypothetical protein [Ignavibacteriota bacterium]
MKRFSPLDATLASAAASSLGRIGTVQSLDALTASRTATAGVGAGECIEGDATRGRSPAAAGERVAAQAAYRTLLGAECRHRSVPRAVRGVVHGEFLG